MSISPKVKNGGMEEGRKMKIKLEEGMKRGGRKVTKKGERREENGEEGRLLLKDERTKGEER